MWTREQRRGVCVVSEAAIQFELSEQHYSAVSLFGRRDGGGAAELN